MLKTVIIIIIIIIYWFYFLKYYLFWPEMYYLAKLYSAHIRAYKCTSFTCLTVWQTLLPRLRSAVRVWINSTGLSGVQVQEMAMVTEQKLRVRWVNIFSKQQDLMPMVRVWIRKELISQMCVQSICCTLRLSWIFTIPVLFSEGKWSLLCFCVCMCVCCVCVVCLKKWIGRFSLISYELSSVSSNNATQSPSWKHRSLSNI